MQGWFETFIDIAFCNGELYGLTHNGEKLVKFAISDNKRGSPMVIADTRVALQMVCHSGSRNSCKEYAVYIVDLHDKLAIAMMNLWWGDREPFFKVYNLVDHMKSETTTCYMDK